MKRWKRADAGALSRWTCACPGLRRHLPLPDLAGHCEEILRTRHNLERANDVQNVGLRLGARRAKPERTESLIPQGTGQARCLDMRLSRTDARVATTASMAAVVRADFNIVAVLAACTSVGSAPTSSISPIPRFSR